MVSRRTLLLAVAGTAAIGAGVTVATGRADEALRLAGARPHPEPHPADVALARGARADADALIRLAESSDADAATLAALREQAEGLPDASGAAADPVDAPLDQACRAVAARRADQATEALSTDLAVVLASSAAGLDQLAATVGGRA